MADSHSDRLNGRRGLAGAPAGVERAEGEEGAELLAGEAAVALDVERADLVALALVDVELEDRLAAGGVAISESPVTWKSTKPWSAYQRGSRSRTSSSTLSSLYSPLRNHQNPSGRVDMWLRRPPCP